MVSDIKCTLCGISLNIARIRTVDEPREHAWSPYSNGQPGSMFADFCGGDSNDEQCCPADRDYPGQKGCMTAFREDVAWRWRGVHGMSRKEEGPTWDEIVFDGLEDWRVDLEQSDGDEDWVPETGDGEDEMNEDEMQYEYESIPESCEGEPANMSDSDTDTDLADGSGYRRWVYKVLERDVYPHGHYPGNILDGEEFRKLLQLAEEFRVKVPTEVRLPCRVSIESLEEPLRSQVRDKHQYPRHKDGTEVPISPHLFHPLNALAFRDPDRAWEHLAGPDCSTTAGYGGNRISVEEMLNCNVVQGLLKKDPSVKWEAESTDEDWEGRETGRWHLTGLKDNIDGRGEPYPNRHPSLGNETFHFDNIDWKMGKCAMAFHPPCLEVFRRVSMKRNGRIDINALGDWWDTAVDFHVFHDLPRHEDVGYGAGHEETWAHSIGTEYLAANPCSVPILESLLVSCKKPSTTQRELEVTRDFPALPIEIQHLIMSYLEMSDIASLDAASPGLRRTAQISLKECLLHEMPHLWEFWCDTPYSKWTGTTAAAIKKAQDEFEEQEEEISRILEVLQEEGHHEEHAQYKEYWDNGYAERKAKSRIPLEEKPSNFVNIRDIDLINFVLGLEKARQDDQMKGLKNRERIWVDCNMILDRVEALQKVGKIPLSYA